MRWSPLIDATDPDQFGDKAVGLARALRAGLPVPPGVALAASFVASVGEGDRAAIDELARLPLPYDTELAVRSSAVGEDSASASFAGQHASEFGVVLGEKLREAVGVVWRSGFCDGALGYRARLGLDQSPRMGVVIQPLINASVAGVLFSRNPMTGANERVIEAARGLDGSVVHSRGVPDLYRLSSEGTLIELTPGDKRSERRPLPAGGIAAQPVHDERAAAATLNQDELQALHRLALQCEQVWNCDHDIEWAFGQDGALHLLQHRPITRRSPQGAGSSSHVA